MNIFIRFLLYSLMIIIVMSQYSCTVSGKIKFGVPRGNVKIESKHKNHHHEEEKDDDDRHKKKKKHNKKEHKDDD